MNCKSCQKSLTESSAYCDSCGAKVVHERITLKHLITDLYTNAFGWDNKFLVTTRKLITEPETILESFINGVRKKYTNPFSYFAIGAAISLLIINQFHDEFVQLNTISSSYQVEAEANPEALNGETEIDGTLEKPAPDSGSLDFDSLMQNWTLFSFLLLPLYTLIAFWVFGKPYNFGEHLVINAYIQGITFLLMIILILLSVWVHPQFYSVGQLSIVAYYSYAYGRLYRHSFGKVLLKLLKFVGISLLLSIVMILLGVAFKMVTG